MLILIIMKNIFRNNLVYIINLFIFAASIRKKELMYTYGHKYYVMIFKNETTWKTQLKRTKR